MEKIYRRFDERGDIRHFSSKISSLKKHKTYHVFVLILSLVFTLTFTNSQGQNFNSVTGIHDWPIDESWVEPGAPPTTITGNRTIRIVAGSEIYLLGNLTISGKVDLIIDGVLIVEGSIKGQGNAEINIVSTGILITTGPFQSSGAAYSINNSGNIVDISGSIGPNNGPFNINNSGFGINYTNNFPTSVAGVQPLINALNNPIIFEILSRRGLLSQILPIDLLSFTASAGEEDILVKWSTATETNNDFFILEKSRDGRDFELVTYLDGAGNSKDVIQYEYTDTRPYAGTSYYRLTQTDFDGTSETFPLITVSLKTDPMASLRVASVYPNAFSDVFTLQYFSPEDNPVEFKLHNLKGELVYQTTYPSHKGFNEFRFTEGAILQGEIFVIQLIQGAQHSGPVKLLKR
ncbi:MAG: hypothetical protein JJU28_13925 [Cyclobacteriaceae bacterium]|nr:hypothetical protein [Cyclobacteriaceae bacterium]